MLLGTFPQSTCPHLSSRAMVQTTTVAKAPKGPPDASPAQAPKHTRPSTAGRHRVAQLPTRSPCQCLHASVFLRRGTRLTHAARPRRQAPPPRTHAGAQAPAAHPRRTRALCTQERPEHKCPGTHPARPRKQASLHTAAARARRRQQDRGQCTSGGSAVDTMVIGCLGVERRAELFFSYLAISQQLILVHTSGPAAGGKREMVFRGLPRSCWEFYGKRSFSVTTPCASPTRVDTKRLAERETLLHRLGSKLNSIVLNSCGNSIIRTENNT